MKGAASLMNQYLTMKDLKEALSDIPENSLKKYLQEHEEFLDFKKENNRYKIHVSEIEKLKLIRQYYAAGLKKEEVTAKLKESGVPITITYDANENRSLISVNNELADMKKLVSFLVQQNEQSRIQHNKVKEQNQLLIEEVHELKHSIEEIITEQKMEYEKVTSLLERIAATQEVAISMEAKKWKWQRLFG
jgi:hypothetical protein